MSEKIEIQLRDFDLFAELVKSALKIVDSATFNLNQDGVTIFGAKDRFARCELISNAIYTTKDSTFSMLDLNGFSKILSTIQQIHEKDYTGFKFIIDGPHVKFQSTKFKTKLNTIDPEKIKMWTTKKVTTVLKPVFEFSTTTELIKRLMNHAFIFGENQKDLRIYLETKSDMETNSLFATLGNKENDLNNDITLKLGLVTAGSLTDRNLIIDLPRMQLFNSLPTKEITISLMDLNVLVSKVTLLGKNDSWFNFTLYCSLLKN